MQCNASFSLRSESEAFVCSLDDSPVLGRVIRGDADASEYTRFLTASYHYVRWSGFLLAQTARGLRRSGRCGDLLTAIDAKATEEGPHDTWLLRDLKNCEVNPELVKGATAPAAIQAYVSWSLALAEAGSPAFLGAAYILEFISARRATTASRNLRARKKIANIEYAVSFLEGHGEADPGHIAELDQMLDAVKDPRDRADIRLSSSVMQRLYPQFFSSVSEPEAACSV